MAPLDSSSATRARASGSDFPASGSSVVSVVASVVVTLSLEAAVDVSSSSELLPRNVMARMATSGSRMSTPMTAATMAITLPLPPDGVGCGA